jgi:hypothetical protein
MSALASPILGLCGYCFKSKPMNFIFRLGESVLICHNCYEKHEKAVNDFALQPPTECAACHLTWEQLSEGVIGPTVPMYPHYLDGIYQLLCRSCSDARIRKTPQPYKGTRFGWEQKL